MRNGFCAWGCQSGRCRSHLDSTGAMTTEAGLEAISTLRPKVWLSTFHCTFPREFIALACDQIGERLPIPCGPYIIL
jgi:hypothetical protein